MSTSSSASSLFGITENRHRLKVTIRRESSTAEWSHLEESGRAVMDEITKRKHRCLLLDLSEVEYLGSSSIAFLMRIWKHINQLQGRMVVVISDQRVYEIIRLSGLVKIWTIFDTVEEADQQLRDERQVGRNIGPMLFLVGMLALLVSGGLYVLQWLIDDKPSRVQLMSQLSLGGLAVFLLLWATRVFSSGMRWVTLAAAVVGCGLCAQSAYAMFGPAPPAVKPAEKPDENPKESSPKDKPAAKPKPGQAAANPQNTTAPKKKPSTGSREE